MNQVLAFTDVASTHPAADAIAYLKGKGVVQGYEDNTFRPEQKVNRAEFIKMVIANNHTEITHSIPLAGSEDDILEYQNLLEERTPTPSSQVSEVCLYNDVPRDAWFFKVICSGTYLGIVKGYSDNTFRPGNNITFVEAAKMVVGSFTCDYGNANQAPEENNFGLLSFPKEMDISITSYSRCPQESFGGTLGENTWYSSYVKSLDIARAIPTSVVRFDQELTRGELAIMLYRVRTGQDMYSSATYESIAQNNKALQFQGAIRVPISHTSLLGEWILLDENMKITDETGRSIRPSQVEQENTPVTVTFTKKNGEIQIETTLMDNTNQVPTPESPLHFIVDTLYSVEGTSPSYVFRDPSSTFLQAKIASDYLIVSTDNDDLLQVFVKDVNKRRWYKLGYLQKSK